MFHLVVDDGIDGRHVIAQQGQDFLEQNYYRIPNDATLNDCFAPEMIDDADHHHDVVVVVVDDVGVDTNVEDGNYENSVALTVDVDTGCRYIRIAVVAVVAVVAAVAAVAAESNTVALAGTGRFVVGVGVAAAAAPLSSSMEVIHLRFLTVDIAVAVAVAAHVKTMVLLSS